MSRNRTEVTPRIAVRFLLAKNIDTISNSLALKTETTKKPQSLATGYAFVGA